MAGAQARASLLREVARAAGRREYKNLWVGDGYAFAIQTGSDALCRRAAEKGHKAALIIELDGSQHYTKHTAEYDRERSKYFEAFGLEVMRFTNAEIDNSFSAVCDLIDAAVRRKTDRI